MKNQKGNTALLLLIVLAILAIGGFYAYRKTPSSYNATSTQQPATKPEEGTISNNSDLQSASNDLDSTNVDSIDNDLAQNDADASPF